MQGEATEGLRESLGFYLPGCQVEDDLEVAGMQTDSWESTAVVEEAWAQEVATPMKRNNGLDVKPSTTPCNHLLNKHVLSTTTARFYP